METVAAIAVATILGVLAALHVYWGMGGHWPGTDEESLVATVVGDPRALGQAAGSMPGPVACFAVAGLLAIAAASALTASLVIPGPARLAQWAAWGAAGVLALRGVGGYFDGWLRPATRETPFYRLNRSLYSPLCIALSVLLFVASLPGFAEGLDRIDTSTVGRDAWQRPADVMAALDIGVGASVADIGAGEGYFVPHLRRAVGDGGVVFAVDVDEAVVESLNERFESTANVTVIKGGTDDAGLPAHEIDLILIVNTYHHIEDRAEYFARLRSALAPGGRVAILEPNADRRGLLGVFVENNHQSHAADVVREMTAAGYDLQMDHDVLPVQIFLVFVPS
jgi:SAM-dependent methyltransferase